MSKGLSDRHMEAWAEDHGYVYNCPGCGQKCDSPAGCGCEECEDEDRADERDTLANLGLSEDDFR